MKTFASNASRDNNHAHRYLRTCSTHDRQRLVKTAFHLPFNLSLDRFEIPNKISLIRANLVFPFRFCDQRLDKRSKSPMKYIFAFVLILSTCFVSYSQTCDPPRIVANTNTDNIFSPEQEMVLGELTLQRLATEFRPIRNPELLAYVESIGAKLLEKFPNTGLKYTFHIIEYPEANAFNIPGGHVFLTRKLIGFVSSEDELASVIAHELGHAAVRHGAQDMSLAMKKVLNVASLGDRKDIIDKYNRLIENARTKRAPSRRGHENEQQLEADKLGFFAMVAAGYDPNASFTFFDRLTESEGKTGSWFSDLFGNTRPEQKRLREISKATELLPQACRSGRSADANAVFLEWQADVVRFTDTKRAESLPGLLWRKELEPKLRSDVNGLKYSADGKKLLVLDDFAVTIIDRESGKVTNQIPAEEVSEAYFAAGTDQVVLLTGNLRFERWDLIKGEPLEVRELVLRRNCWEEKLSPDGNYLACVDQATNINVIETKTGKRIWEKKEFYPLSYFEYVTWLTRSSRDEESDLSFFRIGFSPDSKHVLFSRSNKYRFRLSIDGVTADKSENTAIAIDLQTLKQIDIGGNLKKIASRPYAFIDANRVIGNTEAKLESGGVFSFPAGKRLTKVELGGEYLGATTDPNYVVIKPLQNGATGLLDLSRSQIVVGMMKKDIAISGGEVAFEAANGKILIRKVEYDDSKKMLDGKDVAIVDIPVGAMSDMRTAEVSDDFGWAALSSRTRGGVWNLKTGQRAVFTRGFLSGVVDNEGNSVANFPKFQDDMPSLAFLNPKNGEGQMIRQLAGHGARQYGRFLLTRTSTSNKESKSSENSQIPLSDDEKAELRLRSDVKFEIRDWTKDSVIWTRDFKGAVPRYSFDSYSGRLILYWRIASDEGKARLKEDAALKAKADQLGNMQGDYLIDVIDAFAGKVVGSLLLETGRGSFSVGNGKSERDWLVLSDSEGRILVYSLADGTLRHRFFGSKAALNPTANQLIIETFPGDVTLYSLDSGEKINEFLLKGTLAFSRFSLDGKRLFLFSDNQVGYAIDLAKVKPIERPVIF